MNTNTNVGRCMMRLLTAAWIMLVLSVSAQAQSLNWRLMPGAGNDISVGADNTVWVIGTTAEGGGFGIYRFNASGNWDKIPGGAVRIAVDPKGLAWVVNNQGNIYRYNGSGWTQMPGLAKDIGIGANGTVWVIGTDVEAGGFGIYRWNTGSNNWDKIPGSAVRIAVDPKGNAWVVNQQHNIYSYNGSGWTQLQGGALDIGIGANGAVFIVGADNSVWKWNGSAWDKKDGVLTDISCDAQGNPWGINAAKQIWRSTANASTPAPVTPPPAVTPGNADAAALSPADRKLVVDWMARQVAAAKQPYCYRQSYGRGVGVPLSTCGANEQKNGLLCYPNCRANYGGAGPVCWENCPSGYTDTGALCTRPADSYSNVVAGSCDGGFTDMGLYCYRWWTPSSRQKNCPSGSYYSAGICKVECRSGYTNTGLTCYKGPDTITKNTYTRGAGTPMKCAAGLQEDAGLCYSYCKADYHGVGPVCWQNCLPGTTECGVGCASSTSQCVSTTSNMVIAPLMLALNIFTLGSSSEITAAKGEMMTAIKAGDATAAKAALGRTLTAYATRLSEMTTKEVAQTIQKQFSENAAKWVAKEYAKTQIYMATKQTDAQLAESYARDLAGLDPTGVAGVVEAFTQSMCSSNEPFPNVKPLY